VAEKWAYRVVKYESCTEEQLTMSLNTQGEEGWELFQVKPPFFYFKKRLDEQRKPVSAAVATPPDTGIRGSRTKGLQQPPRGYGRRS
jgi:hypothetical protein